MADVDFQNFSTVQSALQPKPNTIASTTTIAPTTFMTYISGSVPIATITPPVTGQHMLCLIWTTTTPDTTLTTGNIPTALTPTSGIPTLLFYNPATGTYVGAVGNVT